MTFPLSSRRGASLAVPVAVAALLASSASAADLQFGPPQFLTGDGTVVPAAGQQMDPDVALGGGQFLAVWTDYRTSPDDYPPFLSEGTGADVFGIRLDAAGDPIDPAPFPITQGAGDQLLPRVAWNGTDWLVVWRTETLTLPTYEVLEGVRVAPDGTVLDTTPITVHSDQTYYPDFRLSGGAGDWVVVAQLNGAGLRAVRIGGTGVVLDPDVVVKSSSFSMDFDVAFATDEWMVVWDGPFDPPRARRFDVNMAPIGGNTVLPFAESLATDGNEFLVSWSSGPPPLATVEVVRVGHDGQTLGPPTVLYTAGGQAGTCCSSAVWDGASYWVLWGGVFACRVTPAGQVLDPGGVLLQPATGNSSSAPSLAGAPGGGVQAAWYGGTNGAAYPKDVWTGRITSPIAYSNQQAVSLSAPMQVEPDFAVGAGVHVVAFRSRASGTARILAQRIDANGVALDPEPFEVATGPNPGIGLPSIGDPHVAWNGSLFAVTWSDGLNVLLRRMLPGGTFVDPAPRVVMPGFDPDVAAVGSTFLVVGIDLLNGNPQWQATHSMRVDGPSGNNLDPAPNALGGFVIFAQNPHVEAFGSRWLVVWQTNISHDNPVAGTRFAFVDPDGTTPGVVSASLGWRPDVAVAGDRALLVAVDNSIASATTDLDGQILLADGTLLPPFVISSAFDKQLMPAAVWNGAEFVVAWEDKRGSVQYFDENTDVWGARVAPDGIVLDPTGVPLAAGPLPENDPALAAVGGQVLLATSTFRPEASFGSYRVAVQVDPGSPPLVYCTAKTSSAGCVASIGTTGSFQPTSGAGGYAVTAGAVQELKNGLVFAGLNGAAALPFNGGTLCMNPPLKRGPVQSSGGADPDGCGGSFATVVNDGLLIPQGLDAGAGNSAWYQYWFRDPGNGAGQLGTALSDAVQLDFE